METILTGKRICKSFKMKKKHLFERQSYFQAVKDVNLQVESGKTIGIVGESGSGKSTLAEIIGDLQKPISGIIEYDGKNIRDLNRKEYRNFRKNVQFIFQSPKDSLHPFFTIRENLMEPLKIYSNDFQEDTMLDSVRQMMEKVQLDETILTKYASEISGGQAQRVAIARALLLRPRVIIADECVSALDVSVQEQIITLLKELQKEFHTSYVFISHNISAVNKISDYVMVMKNGEVLEEGTTEQVLFHPVSNYTKTLISSSFLIEEDEVHAL